MVIKCGVTVPCNILDHHSRRFPASWTTVSRLRHHWYMTIDRVKFFWLRLSVVSLRQMYSQSRSIHACGIGLTCYATAVVTTSILDPRLERTPQYPVSVVIKYYVAQHFLTRRRVRKITKSPPSPQLQKPFRGDPPSDLGPRTTAKCPHSAFYRSVFSQPTKKVPQVSRTTSNHDTQTIAQRQLALLHRVFVLY